MKKLKLISSLISMSALVAATPIVATSCSSTSNTPTELDNSSKYEPLPINIEPKEAKPIIDWKSNQKDPRNVQQNQKDPKKVQQTPVKAQKHNVVIKSTKCSGIVWVNNGDEYAGSCGSFAGNYKDFNGCFAEGTKLTLEVMEGANTAFKKWDGKGKELLVPVKGQDDCWTLTVGQDDIELFAIFINKGFVNTPSQIRTFEEDNPNEELSFDLSGVETIQNWGNNTSYDIKLNKSAKSVDFDLTDPDVLSASLDEYRTLKIYPKKIGSTTLKLTIKDKNDNELTKAIDLTVDSKVHEFINERTFSLNIWYYNEYPKDGMDGDSWHSASATGWLFYHETDPEKAKNNYTYYLLTNNHVSSGFVDFANNPKKSYLNIGYQDWEDAKNEEMIFGYDHDGDLNSGASNMYSLLDEGWSNSDNDHFKTLFTSYVKANVIKDFYENFYSDLTICKIDLSDFANKPLGINRLNKLNEYADKHDNKLLEFDDYSDLGKNYDLRTLYSGGYPLCFSNEHNGYIYESNNTKCTKFQSHVFDSSSAGPYASTSEIIKYFKSNITSLVGVADLIWTADGVKDNKGVQYAPYWKYLNLNPWLKYGGGSSGSLALRASDPLDPDTYIASGINCSEGIVPGSNNNAWISFQNFVPFAFNFGKNLPEDVDWHIMHKFYNSDAFEKWKPVNDCMYAFD